ncbi:mitotic spindle assembly checkpoint protein MAD1 [Anopheles maculipalpis]|uniref:mitotic spindle assembly checkpoint protein MAD1 n=1 Tax=Anopheles maculipalpis TaxID=1496333 RepID=UPI002159A998|nr:mitotic spindle assembly checkpoint protein MAD1 [Anopheles maculipalpis]
METLMDGEGCDETLGIHGMSSTGASRLSFENNVSFELNRKKRRISGSACDGTNDTMHEGNASADSFTSNAAGYNSTLIAQSPWETRRMKADLIEARSRVTFLKKEIEHLNTEMATTQLRNQHKISSLEEELAFSGQKVADLEKHLQIIRKREHVAKTDLTKTRNQYQQLKQVTDSRQFELRQTLQKMEEKYHTDTHELNMEIRDLSSQVTDLEQQLSLAQDELDTTRELNDTLQSKADAYDQTKRELENTQLRLSEAESRVKTLEYEVGSYEDWRSLKQVSSERIANVNELQKENIRLTEQLRNLQDLIKNKLLLEEQVSSLQTRLDQFEQKEAETASLEVRVKEIERELAEWRQLGKDYSPKGGMVSPMSMRTHIEQILQKDLVLTSEQSSAQTEKNHVQTRIEELQSENAKLNGRLADYKRAQEGLQNIIHRAQKKLNLVTGERDYLKQLLESYENDLTISHSVVGSDGDKKQLRARTDMLEKTLTGYKELCQRQEAELQANKVMPDISFVLTSEQYEKLRKEIDDLRTENEQLKRRKAELEVEVHNMTLRADIKRAPTMTTTAPTTSTNQSKCLRYIFSPAAEDIQAEHACKLKLMAEIERLKLHIQRLQETNHDLTECLHNTDETGNITAKIKESVDLRMQLSELQAKYDQRKELFQQSSEDFRTVVNLLFGFKIDRISGSYFQLRSQYAESPDEYLNFALSQDGSMLTLLESDYAASLRELVETQFKTHNSVPVFLSSLTLELFNRTTNTASAMMVEYGDGSE